MSLKQLSRLRHDLRTKLTLWYTGVLTLTLLCALFVLYLTVRSYFENRSDETILTEYREFHALFQEGGISAFQREAVLESESEGIDHVFFKLFAPDGQVVAHSNLLSWRGLAAPDRSGEDLPHGTPYRIETPLIKGHKHHSRILSGRLGKGYIMQIGHSLKEEEHFLNDLKDILTGFGGSAILVGLICGGVISWRATAGINEITQAAHIIAEGQFGTRVPALKLKGEVATLAVAFNTMLDRIQALITSMQEVTDNIAHDLRSPITRIRTAAELALQGVRDPEEYTTVMAATINECDRLLGLLETMLFISEIESGTREVRMEDVDLVPLLDEACELFQPIAEDKHIALSVQPRTAPCRVKGEPATLQRMVANLLDNALKYTAQGGRVSVALKAHRNEAVIVFEDNGIGISEENLPRIFDRFYRCDKSRQQSGTGLGLSLVKAVVQDLGGAIQVSSQYGRGTLITVSLPRVRNT
jgi:heavy metal sensor kinase